MCGFDALFINHLTCMWLMWRVCLFSSGGSSPQNSKCSEWQYLPLQTTWRLSWNAYKNLIDFEDPTKEKEATINNESAEHQHLIGAIPKVPLPRLLRIHWTYPCANMYHTYNTKTVRTSLNDWWLLISAGSLQKSIANWECRRFWFCWEILRKMLIIRNQPVRDM